MTDGLRFTLRLPIPLVRCDLCGADGVTFYAHPPTCRRCDIVIDLWAQICDMCCSGRDPEDPRDCPMCEAMRRRDATFRGNLGGEVLVVPHYFEHARIADRVGAAFARALAAAYHPSGAYPVHGRSHGGGMAGHDD